jgi:hypothetical protein
MAWATCNTHHHDEHDLLIASWENGCDVKRSSDLINYNRETHKNRLWLAVEDQSN